MSSHQRRQWITSRIVVLAALLTSLALVPATPASAATASLVRTIRTSQWNPPSPDPSGITYWPAKGRLVIVDGEVEEMGIFKGANVFVSTLGGSLTDTFSTLAFTNEPVGIEIASNGRFFIADDSHKAIYEIDLGADQRLTPGDAIRSFSTLAFGNTDPEGLTLGQIGGQPRLFTVDGKGREVYITNPGANGRYDGTDATTHFDIAAMGIGDPEGIEYNPATGRLFILDRKSRKLFDVTTAGSLVGTIDLRPFGAVNPGDVTLAPGSLNSSIRNIYVADRGVDNNIDPKENDGRIYEIRLSG